MNAHLWWYLTRASGLVAWVMLSASVIWGILLSTKAFPGRRSPLWITAMHRWLAGLTVSFTAIHLAALLADSTLDFRPVDLVVPFASEWRPAAVALGVFAVWLLAAVQLTSLAIRRLPRRWWRAIHLTSYAAFWSTSMHAALAGTDATSPAYRVGAAASIVAVAWALMYRLANRRAVRRAQRIASTRPGEGLAPPSVSVAGAGAPGRRGQ